MIFNRWLNLRKETEEFFGLKSNDHLCKFGGEKFYSKMDLNFITLPKNHLYLENYIRDTSPNIFRPLPESRLLEYQL